MAENIIVEIINAGRHCGEGEMGEIVVTELNNYALPLIRYRLGDYTIYSGTSCDCGRQLPVIKDIIGREYDIIRINGKMYHGEFFMYIFEEAMRRDRTVKQFQVLQTDRSSLVVRIIPDSQYSGQTNAFIEKRIKENMGGNIKVTFEIVERIEREKSGKMRIIRGAEE